MAFYDEIRESIARFADESKQENLDAKLEEFKEAENNESRYVYARYSGYLESKFQSLVWYANFTQKRSDELQIEVDNLKKENRLLSYDLKEAK